MLALSATAIAAQPFNLNDVVVKGVNENQKENITKLLNLHKGDVITDAKVSQIIKTLYATGNFNNVSVNTQGNDLVLDLKLKQVIASLNFKGNSLIPTDQIRKTYEENNIKQGSLVNSELITRLNQEVENFYRSQGYSQVGVSTRYQTLDDGTVNVTVYVDENKKAYLKELKLTGNNSFTQKEILEDSTIQPDTKWYNFYTNSNFNNENKQALLNTITDFYKNRGYAKFKIDATKEDNPDLANPQNVAFTIDVNEGSIYTVSGVEVFSRDDILNNKFSELNKIKVSEKYQQSSINDTVKAVKDYLSTLGYAKSEVVPVYNFDDANKTVKVVISVNKGQRYKVNSIQFNGNYLTKDYVVRRLLQQQENATYDLNQVRSDESTLLRTGFFQEVTSETQEVPGAPDLLNLKYKVKEAPNGQFQIGLGYGDTQGLNFTTKFAQSNFLGTGRNFSVDLSKSRGTTAAQIDLVEPYITKSGTSLNTSVYYNYTNTEKLRNYTGYNYTQRQIGASIGSTIPISRYSSLTGSIAYNYNYYYNLYPEFYRGLYLQSIGQAPKVGETWKIHSRNLSLNLSYNYNTYNRYLFPTKGNNFTLAASYTGIASTDEYVELSTSFRNYTPIDKDHKWIISTRFSAAHSRALGNKLLPISALYSVGGFGTLRGYASGSVGPASIYCSDNATCDISKSSTFNKATPSDSIGGDTMVAGGIDFIVPVFRGEIAKTVRTSLFVDAASAWNTKWNSYTKTLSAETLKGLDNYSKPKFRVSYGASIDWQSPLGLLQFSVGLPIGKKSYDQEDKFSINFGSTF